MISTKKKKLNANQVLVSKSDNNDASDSTSSKHKLVVVDSQDEFEEGDVNLADILMPSGEADDVSSISSREDIVKIFQAQLSDLCKRDSIVIYLLKVSRKVFPSNNLNTPFYAPYSKLWREHDLLYRRQVHGSLLLEMFKSAMITLFEKFLDKGEETHDPHFGTNWSRSYLPHLFKNFLMFIVFCYFKQASSVFFGRDENILKYKSGLQCDDLGARIDYISQDIPFFECNDPVLWNERLEMFRQHMNFDYEFTRPELVNPNLRVRDRGRRNSSNARVMLILLNVLPMDEYKLPRPLFKISTPKSVRQAAKPCVYPLCMYDVDKWLNDSILNSYNKESFPRNTRGNAKFPNEDNTYYMLLTELSNCIKLKLSIKIGIRLSSINSSSKPELSMKVNDISIEMTGDMYFKITMFVKYFKNADQPARFVIYSDGTSFDLTIMMIVYLANRNLFVLSLRDCITQKKFDLKQTEELLFPAHTAHELLKPVVDSRRSTFMLMTWCHRRMKIHQSYISSSSTRKGFFITQFSHFIQALPYATNSKLYNMIMSRSGWESEVCWTYGKSPVLYASTLRQMYIYRVKEAMCTGDPKPKALDLVPTASTVAPPVENYEDDPDFNAYFNQELDKRQKLLEENTSYHDFVSSLNIETCNLITSNFLKYVESQIRYALSSKNCKTIIRRQCINKWYEKVTQIKSDNIWYEKSLSDTHQLNLSAIADDPFTYICHVQDGDLPLCWCRDCGKYMHNFNDGKKDIPPENKGCKKYLIDRRFIKLVFKNDVETEACGCLRGKCLKFNHEIDFLLNFASLSATAKICYPEEDLSQPHILKRYMKEIFEHRVRMKLGSFPSCANEIFDIAGFDYFPVIADEDWAFVASDYFRIDYG